LYGDHITKRDFPLASAGSGPAPCFCLIGRIGESQPFFIGRGREPELPELPGLRVFQRRQGAEALRWLRQRTRW